MQYRSFPKIPELPISTLGFGCMRLPTVAGNPAHIEVDAATRLIHQAIDAGVNYFDTAWPYHGQQSEPFLGRALKGRRHEVQLATKLPVWMVEQESDWERFIDQQLVKLDTQRIDFYMLHGLAAGPWDKVRNLRGLRALERAKADGRIGHLGFSFHGSLDAFRSIIDGFDWEFCLIQLNYLDQQYQAGLEGLRYAESHKVGVIVMEALRGGALAKVPPAVESLWARSTRRWSPAEWALRWVWDLPGVVSVISGMNATSQLDENLRIASQSVSLGADDRALVDEVARFFHARMPVPCTTCGYCMPCPSGVSIPDVLSTYNTASMFENQASPRFAYDAFMLKAGSGADQCTECVECEPKCPQNIPIIEMLAKAHAHLTS
jgi:predicted aldo/keto reductase-like oxidoreductase